jgi:oligoendopeptidase F
MNRMFENLPASAAEFMDWPWDAIAPYYQDLTDRPLDEQNVDNWLAQWTRLNDLVSESYARLNVAVTSDTTDQLAESRYNAFLDSIYPAVQAAENRLKQRLLETGLQPAGFDIPLRRMVVEAALFREENLPLLSKERKLASEYNKIIGAQTVTWQGEERTLQQMRPVLQDPQRTTRQQAWQLMAARQLADRTEINSLWKKFMPLRRQLADNAGLPDYREYRWRQMLRLDYSPQNCLQFQRAIEQVAVPAATRVYAKHSLQISLERLRPWDLDQDLYPLRFPALPSYGQVSDLSRKAQAVFTWVDPKLGEQFGQMQAENLLDLENHKGKAPGAYCTSYPVSRRPFIFMNAVGLASDVRTILHESGHAFHNFERLGLPYAQQRIPGLEFAEVASMSMELLAMPYLDKGPDAFYQPEAARDFIAEHLEHLLTFWPYMAVVDAFQHWVYTQPHLAQEPASCDAKWLELWQRFLPGVDWSGLEEEAMTGWQRKQHIFRYPFYYVEYGLAQLGAVLVWRNARRDQAGAVKAYRRALALGGTRSLPELYQAAGARFAFDSETLAEAVELVEEVLGQLELPHT